VENACSQSALPSDEADGHLLLRFKITGRPEFFHLLITAFGYERYKSYDNDDVYSFLHVWSIIKTLPDLGDTEWCVFRRIQLRDVPERKAV